MKFFGRRASATETYGEEYLQLQMTVTYLNTTPKTPVYHKPPLERFATTNIFVLIPGNPGLVDFYISHLDSIRKHFPQFETLCIGHVGFLDSTKRKTYDVSYQIEHKYDVLKQLILTKNESNIIPNLYFLHHSMGSFVYQRTIRRLYHDKNLNGKFNIKFSGFVTPTIHNISASSSGRVLSGLMQKKVPIVSIVLVFRFFVSLIPALILRKLLYYHLLGNKTGNGFENSVEGAYKIVKSGTVVKQALEMAKEEMLVIDTQDDINDWYFKHSDNGIKNWLFFARDDHWVANETREYLINKYGNSDNTICEVCDDEVNPISHSFCVAQSEQFANITVERIKEICNVDLD